MSQQSAKKKKQLLKERNILSKESEKSENKSMEKIRKQFSSLGIP